MRMLTAASIAATLAMSSVAYGQTPPAPPAVPGPAVKAPAPRPTTTPGTPAPSTATAPRAGGSTSTVATASTAAEARQQFVSFVSSKEAACKAKGALYVWTPPHTVGDLAPTGGYYVKSSIGACRPVSLKRAIESGLVTVRSGG